MIRRIELVNFMSHVHTVLEPADGLTVLVGPNNCGKSAVVAALQILCHNENSTYVTRHDERECSVTVETGEGHIVQWRRRNAPAYFLDGREFSRLERGFVPQEVQDALRLPKVTADGNREFDVHFGEQKSPVFLLDRPASHAAQFFASSSDAACLVEMQKLHQYKMQAARSERKSLEASAARLDADLAILAASEELDALVSGAETRHADIARLDSAISLLLAELRAIGVASERADRLGCEASALAGLRPPPSLEPTAPITESIASLERTRLELDRQGSHATALARLEPPPPLADEAPLRRLTDELGRATRRLAHLEAESLEMRSLASPPLLEDAADLRSVLAELARTRGRVGALRAAAAITGGLAPPPELHADGALADDLRLLRAAMNGADRWRMASDRLEGLSPPPLVTDFAPLQAALGGMRSALADVEARAAEVECAELALIEARDQMQRWAERHPICPTCRGPLDAAHLLAHAGPGPKPGIRPAGGEHA